MLNCAMVTREGLAGAMLDDAMVNCELAIILLLLEARMDAVGSQDYDL